MQISVEYDSERNVLFGKGTGFLGINDFLQYYSKVKEITLRPNYRVLADFSEANGDLSFDDISKMAEQRKSLAKSMGNIKIAIVGTRDIVFGVSRMYQSLLDNEKNIAIQVFRTRKEAETWLEF